MTIALRYAARSDVGLLREGNEDSAYASGRLLAVADGMGGHAHGEVASSVAIAAMASLEESQPGGDLLNAIEAAVRDANRKLHEMVGRDPSLKGMGTTLTAMLWNGAQVALVHVGDSRAYLLRRGELYQITHDHTLVQQLVDDGRITAEEATTHPQRSILLRALDGSGEVDPDLTLREAQVGDRYLLCSDGLSGVVSAETMHATLTNIDDPEEIVRQLIDLANRGGGPDNITCVLADVVELGDGVPAPGEIAVVGAAGMTKLRTRGKDAAPGSRANSVTAPQPIYTDGTDGPAATAPGRRVRRRRVWPVLAGVVGVTAIAASVGGYFGWQWVQSQYYVGVRGDNEIVVYRGIQQAVGPIELSEVVFPTARFISDLTPSDREMVKNGIEVNSLTDGIARINALEFTALKPAPTKSPAAKPPASKPPVSKPAATPTPAATKT